MDWHFVPTSNSFLLNQQEIKMRNITSRWNVKTVPVNTKVCTKFNIKKMASKLIICKCLYLSFDKLKIKDVFAK